jgi:hypothetical protein
MDNFKVAFYEAHISMEPVNDSDVLAVANSALENGSDSKITTDTQVVSIEE